MPSEIEWQLEAQDLRLVLRWLESADTNGVTVGSGPTVTQVDTYLDTEDRRLDRAGYSVRVRRAARTPVEATFKSLAPAGEDALRVRLELAEDLEDDDPDAVSRAPGPVGTNVRALVGSRKLVPLFDVQTRRRTFPLTSDGAPSGELLLDDTAIRAHDDGRVLSRLRRVEVEVPEESVELVGALVESLRRTLGLQPAVLSKYEAALVASGNDRAAPETFGPTSIEPGDTIGQVALAVLRRQFETMLAKEPGTRLGHDIEELHDMRVATRRLRAALAFFAGHLPAEAERLRPELAWLGRELGTVRDLDVQLQRLAGEPGLATLRDVLAADRERARESLLAALESARYERLVRRFGAMLRSRSGARTEPATAVLPALIERRHRAVVKAMRGVRADPVPDTYHQLRIRSKRLRYALEFAADVYPGSTRALIRRTIELQDVLGAHQDAFVLIEYLHDLAATRGAELGPEVVFAMGGLAERQRGVMAKLRSRVPAAADPVDGKAWRRLRRRITAAAAGNTPDDGGNGSGGRRRVQHGAPGDRAAGAGGDHGDVHEAGAAGTRA